MQNQNSCDTIYCEYVYRGVFYTFFVIFSSILYFFIEMSVKYMLSNFYEYWEQIKRALLSFDGISDLLDIVLVAFVIYSIIKLIRETRALQLAKGVVLLAFVYFMVSIFDMQTSQYILSFVFGNLLVILIVIFAPEIRHALESMGRSSVSNFNIFKNKEDDEIQESIKNSIHCVSKACSDMSDKQIGALIVFQRDSLLGEITKTGTTIDATVTTELVNNIFFPKAPMHDGATIIHNGRIVAAGCILPLTGNNNEVSSELGTRHRAAIGMSESSDALVVVVSEETGIISIAEKGVLSRNISVGDLRERLSNALIKNDTKDNSKIKKIFRGKKNENK